jgi:hypothetical protein
MWIYHLRYLPLDFISKGLEVTCFRERLQYLPGAGKKKTLLRQFQLVKLFLLVLLCMITARSAAMAFKNRYLDRHFDAEKSKNRHPRK